MFYKPLDFSINTLMHGAFKRELDRIQVGVTQLSENPGQEPAGLVRRWQFFSAQLARHQESEDKFIWPLVRERTSKPDDIVIVDAMESEHGTMRDVMVSVDSSFVALGDAEEVDLAVLKRQLKDLSVVLRGHCDHEERDGAALVARHIEAEDLSEFHEFVRSGDDAPLVVPWMCDGAPEADQVAAWGLLPGFLRVFARPMMNRKYNSFKSEIR